MVAWWERIVKWWLDTKVALVAIVENIKGRLAGFLLKGAGGHLPPSAMFCLPSTMFCPLANHILERNLNFL